MAIEERLLFKQHGMRGLILGLIAVVITSPFAQVDRQLFAP
jgi:hypothetical protein